MEHFNGLTPAEDERLAILIEECAEVIQAATKIQRHGYESDNPLDPDSLRNREALEKECGHVRASMIRMCEAGDLSKGAIHHYADEKARSIGRWLHHQSARDPAT